MELQNTFNASQDRQIKSIFVCMGSGEGNDPSYRSLAKAVGSRVGERGYGLVYGGGEAGLMGIVANAARRRGAKVTAVMTEAFARNPEDANPLDDETIVVEKLNDRKEKMITAAEVTMIIPGGIGTLDEMMEVLAVNDMMRFENEDAPIHPVVVINENGFYNDLLNMFKTTVKYGFANIEKYRCLYIAGSADEAFDLVDRLNKTPLRQAKELSKGADISVVNPKSFAEQVVEARREAQIYAEKLQLFD